MTQEQERQRQVEVILEMAEQNLSEIEELAENEKDRQAAFDLRNDLMEVWYLIEAAPRLETTLQDYWASHPDSQWADRAKQVLAEARRKESTV